MEDELLTLYVKINCVILINSKKYAYNHNQFVRELLRKGLDPNLSL